MNMYIIFLLFFIRNVTPLLDKCKDTIYMKIPYAEKLLIHHIEVMSSVSSAQKCLEHCRDHRSCKSVGIDTSLMTCYLYDGRMYAGRQWTRNSNMIYYWKLEAECPVKLRYTEDPTSKMCYKFYSKKSNWLDAQATCEKDGGHLFIADTIEKMIKSNKYLRHGQFAFIGATDIGDNKVWNWFNGKPIDQSQFHDGEPNNLMNNENCLTVLVKPDRIALNGVTCRQLVPFFCEIATSSLYLKKD